MSSILIDTDILIDAARQDAAALATLTTLEQRKTLLAVSCVTQMELLVGCRNKTELQKTERFLRRFSILPLNQDTCDRAVELLRQYRLSHGPHARARFHHQEPARFSLHHRSVASALPGSTKSFYTADASVTETTDGQLQPYPMPSDLSILIPRQSSSRSLRGLPRRPNGMESRLQPVREGAGVHSVTG